MQRSVSIMIGGGGLSDPRKREDGRMDEELDYPRSIGDRYTLKVQLYKDVLGRKLSDKDFFIMV